MKTRSLRLVALAFVALLTGALLGAIRLAAADDTSGGTKPGLQFRVNNVAKAVSVVDYPSGTTVSAGVLTVPSTDISGKANIADPTFTGTVANSNGAFTIASGQGFYNTGSTFGWYYNGTTMMCFGCSSGLMPYTDKGVNLGGTSNRFSYAFISGTSYSASNADSVFALSAGWAATGSSSVGSVAADDTGGTFVVTTGTTTTASPTITITFKDGTKTNAPNCWSKIIADTEAVPGVPLLIAITETTTATTLVVTYNGTPVGGGKTYTFRFFCQGR